MAMEDLLTVKDVQELLKMDRTTIYRMLEDGRLSGFKVGQQWRFPKHVVECCLTNAKADMRISAQDQLTPGTQVLPIDCFEPIQDVFAAAANVGSVTTTLQGKPLTHFINSCTFCELILASPEGRKRCEASWMRLSQTTDDAPSVERCHAGLGYARGRIQVADEFVAMTFAGQFVSSDAERAALNVNEIARECNIPEEALRKAAGELRIVEPSRAQWLLTLLNKVAVTFSHIGEQRLVLLKRLRRVVEAAQV
jgi:excisionase family DNA binding protein